MYAPVMSQETRTHFVSSGLMVGRKFPPPPPGPITSQRSNLGAPAPRPASRKATYMALTPMVLTRMSTLLFRRTAMIGDVYREALDPVLHQFHVPSPRADSDPDSLHRLPGFPDVIKGNGD